MRNYWSLICLLFVIYCVVPVQTFAAESRGLLKLETAWMDEHETFLIWYAKRKNWDYDVGLDISLNLYSSGMDIVNAHGSWAIAGNGAVPAVVDAVRNGTEIVLIGNDESYTNAVLVRETSPIVKTSGYNKKFPNVLGHPKDVRGKTFLTTTSSSAHYALSVWLNVLGLADTDVVIKHMPQAQALEAFKNGEGDGVALWAPHMYQGETAGWKVAGTVHSCQKGLPIVITADKTFAAQNPKAVSNFISVYLRAVDAVQKASADELADEYRLFFREFAKTDYSRELAIEDLKTHPIFSLKEQKYLFDDSNGLSVVQSWQKELAQFFLKSGKLSRDELKKIADVQYVNKKYLYDVN